MPEKYVLEKYWYHKKYKRHFGGAYEIDAQGERIFVLEGLTGKLERKRIVFESWQSAKKNGWVLEPYRE